MSIMKGAPQHHRKYYGSLDDTVITIEADESTPLLVDRLVRHNGDNNNNNLNNNGNNSEKEWHFNERPNLKYASSSWSFGSSVSHQSNGSDYSTKSFKSHFTELRVLMFALILAAAVSIAIYLLVIESRLPSITLSLDLVSHDIWSNKNIPKSNRLQHNKVDHIILMQTGYSNCDTTVECLRVLKEMQNKTLNDPEELPYNFLVGGDGQAYEVRGWDYQSNMDGVPQEHSLVIGIIGNFDQNSPDKLLLQTVQSLIQASFKRRMINRKFRIYGLRRNDQHRTEGQHLFSHVMSWSNFDGFLTQF